MLGEYPESNLKNKVEQSLSKMIDEVKSMNSEMKRMEMELHSLSTKRSNLRSASAQHQLSTRSSQVHYNNNMCTHFLGLVLEYHLNTLLSGLLVEYQLSAEITVLGLEL